MRNVSRSLARGIRATTAQWRRPFLAALTLAVIATSALAPATQAQSFPTAWLLPGQKLTTGQSLLAPNGKTKLTLQANSALVLSSVATGQWLWNAPGTIWKAESSGKPMTQVVMQDDGELVGLNSSGSVYYSTKTSGYPGSRLDVTDDGNLVILDAGGEAIWGAVYTPISTPAPARLRHGQELTTGQMLVSSNWKTKLVLQADGNLVLYRIDTGAVLWASHTLTEQVFENGTFWTMTMTNVVMQYDGNVGGYESFVNSDVYGGLLWQTQTQAHPGASLVLQDDGNMVVLDANNSPIWATNTHVP